MEGKKQPPKTTGGLQSWQLWIRLLWPTGAACSWHEQCSWAGGTDLGTGLGTVSCWGLEGSRARPTAAAFSPCPSDTALGSPPCSGWGSAPPAQVGKALGAPGFAPSVLPLLLSGSAPGASSGHPSTQAAERLMVFSAGVMAGGQLKAFP